MRSRIFYPRLVNTTRNVKRNRTSRIFLLLGIFLFSTVISSLAQGINSIPNDPAPGYSQQFPQACNNQALDLRDYLGVDGYTPGSVLTYSVVPGPGPNHGTISVVPNFIQSAGSVTYPAFGQITYTPTTGYTGVDQFWINVNDGTNSVNVVMNMTVNAAPSILVPNPNPTVCLGTTSTTISYSNPVNVGATTQPFYYTGNTQTFTIPVGVNSIEFDLVGARGGKDDHSDSAANPGKGGRLQGTLNVTGFNTLSIEVGGMGQTPLPGIGAAGGYNGGGNTFFYFYGSGGAGGGATDIRMGGNRVAVAGGGGGNGWDHTGPIAGGDGGGYVGGNGANNAGGNHANGGTQFGGGAGAVYGGWLPGMAGGFGTGGAGSTQGISGGGGGGWYGGGGGVWSGGAGGSSYADPVKVTGVATTAGANDTDGMVMLRYQYPGSSYSINWDLTAEGQGFVDVPYIPLPSSPIVVSVPAGALPGTYNAVLRVANSTCTSDPIAITVTVKPIPAVNISQGNIAVCNGQSVTDIDFNSTVPGTIFNYTNTHPEIDSSTSFPLAAVGSGSHIEGFTGYNPTDAPIVNVLTVTPDFLQCIGAPQSINITVNPTPRLGSTPTPGAICDGSVFNYTSTSPTLGGPVTYAWFRDTVAGIGNSPASGTGDNINETLFNTTANQLSVVYVDTIKANGCISTRNITVKVDPTPFLSSTATPMDICDSTLFTYIPTSNTAGTAFAWSRDEVAGISNPAAVGTDDPDEVLDNTTNAPVTVTYTYTLTAASCVNVQQVMETVNPTPALTSPTSLPAICDSTHFEYTPTSPVPGAAFTWVRDTIVGIDNPSTVGTDGISEWLVNTTAHPIVVNYVYTIVANNCINVKTVKVTVNPRPVLIGSLVRTPICDSTAFSFLPTSFTVGTSFAWTRDSIAGISNSDGAGTGNPNEILHNTTADPVNVTYLYTLTANGCAYQQNVTVIVNPDPKLSNSLTPAAICDSSVFNYPVASATAGAAFTWYRPYVAGILQVAASNTGNPNELLINTTNVPVNVVYVYTVTANGCSNTQRVTVSVNPTPHLTSAKTASVCSGERFTYAPGSFTAGTIYSWVRNSVTNITPATASGNGDISDSMVNATLLPINVVYLYRLGINGCLNTHTDNVVVTVKPKAPVPGIAIAPGHDLCSNTMYMNFGASSPVAVDYSWSAVNATVWATGSTGQYAIVNFENPGTAVVKLNSNLVGVGCITSSEYTVNVSNAVSDNPQVIYFDGQFICLQTNAASYQWGYDDASTLDSVMLVGESNQNYTNTNPDLARRKYWVMTTQNGCMQKTYYNVPTGIDDINDISGIRVYPNPTSDYVNVDINAKINGDIQVELYNMLGQKINSVPAQDHKARINVAALPSGVYLIDCYRDGVKLAAARFIKN